jgi:hypothetical protein
MLSRKTQRDVADLLDDYRHTPRRRRWGAAGWVGASARPDPVHGAPTGSGRAVPSPWGRHLEVEAKTTFVVASISVAGPKQHPPLRTRHQ